MAPWASIDVRSDAEPRAADPQQQFFALFFKPGDPNPADPEEPARRDAGRPAVHRLADVLRLRRRPLAQQQEDRQTLSSILFDLMGQAQAEPTSPASRNLLRALTMKVPSGQRVAAAMQLPALGPGDLDDLKALHLEKRTPLWFYILREAEVMASGEHLVAVGGRIVAEVIYGLIEGDGQSYLRQDPDWEPTYGQSGSFGPVDLLKAAGAVAKLS
jgi:hypothetical protein